MTWVESDSIGARERKNEKKENCCMSAMLYEYRAVSTEFIACAFRHHQGFRIFRGVLDFFGELPVDFTAVVEVARVYWNKHTLTLLTLQPTIPFGVFACKMMRLFLYMHVNSIFLHQR